MEARAGQDGVLPPLRDAWARPALHTADDYFTGPNPSELYIALADEIPAQNVTWATPVAAQVLGYVLSEATGYLRAGRPPGGLDAYVRGELAFGQGYVQRAIRQGTFADGDVTPTGK